MHTQQQEAAVTRSQSDVSSPPMREHFELKMEHHVFEGALANFLEEQYLKKASAVEGLVASEDENKKEKLRIAAVHSASNFIQRYGQVFRYLFHNDPKLDIIKDGVVNYSLELAEQKRTTQLAKQQRMGGEVTDQTLLHPSAEYRMYREEKIIPRLRYLLQRISDPDMQALRELFILTHEEDGSRFDSFLNSYGQAFGAAMKIKEMHTLMKKLSPLEIAQKIKDMYDDNLSQRG